MEQWFLWESILLERTTNVFFAYGPFTALILLSSYLIALFYQVLSKTKITRKERHQPWNYFWPPIQSQVMLTLAPLIVPEAPLMNWMFVSPQNSYVEILTPNVLGGGALGRWLGHEGEAFTDGISVLRGHVRQIFLSAVWGCKGKVAISKPEGGILPRAWLSWPWSLTSSLQ